MPGTLPSPENISHEQVRNRTCPHGVLKGRGNQINNGVNMYLRTTVVSLTKDLQRALREDIINRENLPMLGVVWEDGLMKVTFKLRFYR